jgi:hypothetical protein
MSKMSYLGRWCNYDRHEDRPNTILKLTASSDFEALKKVFIAKVAPDLDDVPAKLTKKLLIEEFRGIDVGGWSYLKELKNVTTGEVVFNMGLEDDEEENV